LDREDNDEVLAAKLEQHYRDNWPEISEDIQTRAEKFDLDPEAKATLAEALAAHKHGFYRSVCRLLLPEIERVARVELLGNDVGVIKIDKVIGEPGMELGINQTNPPRPRATSAFDRAYLREGRR
jgi:hypothetical protein